jgi:hypothetical protein
VRGSRSLASSNGLSDGYPDPAEEKKKLDGKETLNANTNASIC